MHDPGPVIAAHRDELKLSRNKFGWLIGRDPGAIGTWERGEAKPDFDSLCDLVQKGGIDPIKLLGNPVSINAGKVGSAA